MVTRKTITAIALVVGLNALLWGVILFLPPYATMGHPTILFELFSHRYVLWAFGCFYLGSAVGILLGVYKNIYAATRTGLLTFSLLGVYRCIGAFLLYGGWSATLWPYSVTIIIIAIVLWLYYGRVQIEHGD